MPTPMYRYVLCDLLTDRLLADLPLRSVSFGKRISRTDSLNATLEAGDARRADLARLCYDYAGRSALWVYRDNELWWGGIPWTVEPDQGARGPLTVSITAATFDSYAHHRHLYTNVSYTGVDEGIIIPDLWRRLQTDPRGDIAMVALNQPTGVTRDRTYLASDHAYVGQLIEDLGDVIDGAEHTVDVYLDGNGNRVKRLRVAHRIGVTEPRVMFQRAASGQGGRVQEWKHTADAVDGGTVFQTRGDAPDGNAGAAVEPLLSAPTYRDDLLAAGWPLLDSLEDRSGVKVAATLNGYAQANAAVFGGAPATSEYTVEVGNTGWSPARLGDRVRIKLDDLWHHGVDTTIRPVGCKVTAPDRGQPEQVTLILDDAQEE